MATASLNLDTKIDLIDITRENPDASYDPERFPGVVLKIQNPKATFLIFSTGKMVITGLNDPNKVSSALWALSEKLERNKINFSKVTQKVENLVVSGDFKHKINLNLATILLDNIMYEPEVFPGLIYYLSDPKSVILIFSTGKFVCTGSNDFEALSNAIYSTYHTLEINEIVIKDENQGDHFLRLRRHDAGYGKEYPGH